MPQYKRSWSAWKAYCRALNVPHYRAKASVVMQYLLEKSTHVGTSSVYTQLSAIAFHYRRKGLSSPSDDTRVRMFMKGLKKSQVGHVVKRAKPMTVAILKRAVRRLAADGSLTTWRTVWRMCIGFSNLLRWDDMSRIQVNVTVAI